MKVYLTGFSHPSNNILKQASEELKKLGEFFYISEDSIFEKLSKSIEITEIDLETREKEKTKKEKFIPAPPSYKYNKQMRRK